MNPVEEYIDRRPAHEHALWIHIRWLILQSDEGVKEAIKWSLPVFALHNKQWIYLNPLKSGGLEVSFMNGAIEPVLASKLRVDGRKLVGSFVIPSLDEYNENDLLKIMQISKDALLKKMKKRS
ncbi:DUF1801 domain-containing protein [Phaeocystidibacter marisrubri]|uniref:DUF1801 domain-containing protein n=1 Tax=Phaeocystidibacter marisrubri TaxID=1577780 RepID=A0A6L3ZFZ9_9FLAO|nr:DUF1801 domain-containing protein [Phaeocystidibacter marisrubri]KAB2815869.1 DUF1801 domain-containing protein [Phaeocystidibacter marisrubri]GGH66136.1 hypothetical protein GCM10011318_03790 [Phaeocystidibacter marisrubri]